MLDTSIGIRWTTKDRLRKRGRMGDSFDKVINELLDMAETHKEKTAKK